MKYILFFLFIFLVVNNCLSINKKNNVNNSNNNNNNNIIQNDISNDVVIIEEEEEKKELDIQNNSKIDNTYLIDLTPDYIKNIPSEENFLYIYGYAKDISGDIAYINSLNNAKNKFKNFLFDKITLIIYNSLLNAKINKENLENYIQLLLNNFYDSLKRYIQYDKYDIIKLNDDSYIAFVLLKVDIKDFLLKLEYCFDITKFEYAKLESEISYIDLLNEVKKEMIGYFN